MRANDSNLDKNFNFYFCIFSLHDGWNEHAAEDPEEVVAMVDK